MLDQPKPLTDEELDRMTARLMVELGNASDATRPADVLRLVAEVRRLREAEREARLLLIARLPPADDPAVPHTRGRSWDDVHIADLVRQLVKQLQ